MKSKIAMLLLSLLCLSPLSASAQSNSMPSAYSSPFIAVPTRPMVTADRLAYWHALNGTNSTPTTAQLNALNPDLIFAWQHFSIVSNGVVYVATSIEHTPSHSSLYDWWWWLVAVCQSAGATPPYTVQQVTATMYSWATNSVAAVQAQAAVSNTLAAVNAQVPVNNIILSSITAESVWRDLQAAGYDLNTEPPSVVWTTNLVYSPLVTP